MAYRGFLQLVQRVFVVLLALGASACDSGDGHGTGHRGDAGVDPADAATNSKDSGSAQTDSGADARVADGSGDSAGAMCAELTLGGGRLFFNAFGELTGLRYPVAQMLGDPELPDYVLIELYDSTTVGEDGTPLPALVPGDFDLSIAPDDRLVTCQHCVSLVTDVHEGTDDLGFPIFEPTGWYYADGGQMHLEEVHDPLNAVVENTAVFGTIANVEVVELDASDPEFPIVAGGACFRISEATFDTRPTPGQACEDVEDCGNELLEICDPATLRCVDEFQCTIDSPCATDAFCIQQSPLNWWGACYPKCTPLASGTCPEGFACVQYGISEHDGYCLKTGDAAVGAVCEVKDAVTGCQSDAVCVDGACVAQCGYFSGAQACPTGACDVLGHCLSPDAGDPASLGETCQLGVEVASPCARDGDRFDGICFGYSETDPYVCSRSCFVDANDYDGDADDGIDDPDCAADEFCALRFSSGLGICLPDPVCGDGAFGEVEEACDDGNTVSGDGCSADCKTVEYAALCSAAADLPVDGSVQGTTAGGVDGFLASCQFGLARGRVYSFTAPGPGQLELRLTSDTTQIVSVRTDCATPSSELGCGYSLASSTDAPLIVQVADAAVPVTVLVTAFTVLEEGPFALTTAFTPQVCGDGMVMGSEACDDGNVTAGDGCSADCSSIEYPYWCSQAQSLPLDVTVSGEVGGQWSLYTPTCGYGNGADVLYELIAPASGNLTVSLNQLVGDSYADLALYVLDKCGPPASVTELACSANYDPDGVTLAVTQGETVFIGVDALQSGTGLFEITARIQ